MIIPATPIESLPRVTARILPALKRLGIKIVRDLLLHFPSRYEDFSNEKNISDLVAGEIAAIQGTIRRIANIHTSRQRMTITEAVAEDDTGTTRAIWFNQPFLARNLQQGNRVQLSGKIALGKRGLYLQNPAYEKITMNSQGIHTRGLVAIYPETRGITSRWLRFLIRSAMAASTGLTDSLPEETRARHTLPDLSRAVRAIHAPRTPEEATQARRRFDFETLLLIQLNALQNKLRFRALRAPAIPTDLTLVKQFVASLPYRLTDAQRRSLWEILQDLAKPHPMNRLLEGDVGSGKTVVAAGASLIAARAGLRVAFMAPTEILAHQHYETLQKTLAPFDVSIGLLTGTKKMRGQTTQIIIGTHALIQKKIQFEKLGLVIVDEQHRFGVEQRATLIKQNSVVVTPHFLSMTATPIPRTLALTVYGDLDLSVLDEMPRNRKKIITQIVEPTAREKTYAFLRSEIEKGRQVFIICPRIEIAEEDENARGIQKKILQQDTKTVKQEYEKLSKEIFPDRRVAMLHGKMKAKEKEETMKKFTRREYDILVSTSVVEVGVDIPNATVMMIEGAERFGLATLHQFRGRVGRGADQSFCFLFTSDGNTANARLRAMTEAHSGFELAEMDLTIRGAGDPFGTKQWGLSPTIVQALANPTLVRDVRREAATLLQHDPLLHAFPILQKEADALQRKLHPE